MQIFFLLGIIIEGIVLLLLSIFKKLTRKAFVAITVITVLCSALFMGIELYDAKENKVVDQRESLYMTARLLQDGHKAEAMEALASVVDEECLEYHVQALRGLALNINEYYETAVVYLEDVEDDNAKNIYLASLNSSQVEGVEKEAVIEKTVTSLEASEKETEAWELKMKFLYLGQDFEEFQEDIQEENLDTLALVKMAIADRQYADAFETMKKAAENGELKEDIILSNMYVHNYNLRTLETEDVEYDALWNDITQIHAELNLLSLELMEERERQNKNGEDDSKLKQLEKEYSNLSAKYSLAHKDRTKETVGRALNYLIASKPEDADTNIGYQLQLSRLYFVSMQEDLAKECLDKIFASEIIDQKQWLGTDAHLLRESYLIFLSGGGSTEYKGLYNQMMNHLYQGVFDTTYSDFQNFVIEYLESLLSGIVISNIDSSNFPKIEANVVCINEELELDKEQIILTDTDVVIDDFLITEKEVTDLSLCFVLDKSGSMSGNSIRDAKVAIRECIMSLDENVEVSMVSFDSTAQIECGLTHSNYLVLNKLEAIEATGGTDIVAGLKLAYETMYAASGKKVVILLSDGAASDSGLDEVLAKLRGDDVECYAIGLVGSEESYLMRVANGTNGKYIPANDSSSLSSIYKEIQETLTHIYTISYTRTETEQESRYTKVKYKDSLIQAKKKYDLNVVEEQSEISVYVEEEQSADYFKQTGGSKKGAAE